MATSALYPGTFSPLQRGHEHVVLAARRITGKLFLGYGHNADKSGKERFTLEERVSMGEEFINHNGLQDFCEIFVYEDLLVDAARRVGADFLIRGLRGTSDIDSEYGLNVFNKTFDPSLETVFLMPPPELMMISSTFVMAAARAGKPVSQWVNPFVAKMLEQKFAPTDL